MMVLFGMVSESLSQTVMPLPPHASIFSATPRGYWFTAPVSFTIVGVKISPEAGTGSQFIHIMKCNDPFPVAFGSQSTNFNTLAYISNAPNNVVQPVNIQVNQGDVIGIMGTVAGNSNSYSASQITTSTIAGQTVTLSRFGHQASIESGPATSYWGIGPTELGQISRIEMTYTVGPCIDPPFVGNAISTISTPCSAQNFELALDTATGGQGQSYQWQMSSDNSFWNSIAGATGATFLTNQTFTNWYRCIVTCGTGSDTSGAVQVTTTSAAFPGGTYTINNSLPASSINFITFNALAQSFACNGISGPIVVNVANTGTPYNEQLLLGNIPGLNATNTITINGNGATISAAGGANRATITMDATQYVTINNLRIETTANATAYAVELRNDARYIVFDGCEIVAPITGTLTTSAAFVTSNSPTGAVTAGLAARDIQVKNCLISGGYYGLIMNGPTTAPWSTNNIIENNVIRDFYAYGLYIRGQENSVFIGNEITRPQRANTTTTYGIYTTSGLEGVRIEGNSIHNLGDQLLTSTLACYPIYMTTSNATLANPCVVASNLIYNTNMNGIHYGIYLLSGTYLNFYHNTVSINNDLSTSASAQRAVFVSSTAGVYEFKNNIFSVAHSGTGAKYCFYRTSTAPTFVIDYNQYHINSGGTTNYIGYQTANQTTFADWQLLGHEANGVQGDPVFGGLATNNPTPLSGFGNNLGQNLNTLVPLDFNGNTRSATPDMGAIEYTPITDDIALISGAIARGECLSTTDTVRFVIQNVIGGAVDFALNPLSIAWNITGPVNSNGFIVVNTGTLPLLGTLTVDMASANLSALGVYTLNAYLLPNTMNLAAGNDTLVASQTEVNSLFSVSPGPTTVTSAQTVVEIRANSPFLPGGNIFITEVCHWRLATGGTPVGGWPSYLLADDYVELTGVPNSDISGYVFETYGTQTGPFVLPPGTVFGPNGTLILATGQLGSSVPSPSNFYYHTGGTVTFSSTTAAGYVIRDPQGNVVDAVAYGSFTFPANSGVTSSDWTGSTPAVSSAGNRLEGPDLNNATGWVNSASILQTPNIVNPNVSVPSSQGVSGFTWTLNGVVVDTLPTITVGPWTQDGVYHYIANFVTPCGTFTDTVTITVVLPCDNPNNASYTSPTCGELFVSWNSVPNRVNSSLEYGPAGFTPGTGSITLGASSPLHITGLTGNTNYDIYIVDTCANGFSNSTLLTATTFGAPLPTVSATFNQTSTGATSATVSFDASASADYSTLSWDFGDGSTATGATVDHTYSANQSYTVVLTGTNNCGTTTQTYQVTVAGIGLESEISQTLSVYPNPNRGVFSITFSSEIKDDVQISINNATGQLIGEWNNASVQGQFKQDFDLSHYPAGVYFLKISSNQGVVNQRIILQR